MPAPLSDSFPYISMSISPKRLHVLDVLYTAQLVRSWGLGVTTSGSETLLVKVPHAARNIGHMEDLSHGQELAALSQAALGQAENNKLCSRPRLQVAYNYTIKQ
ncbi:hypothetical protein B296_00032927 [Ensete ventricosum]|uniref:Uncharacterized protein n=1 Tax=Ensete ventricosum TaxID=4639 RepID=A0A426XCN4_ENSVE|nr:hypothetical protein B296_00032927 [Ensete ventricosum]